MTISKVTCSEPKPLTPADNKQTKIFEIILFQQFKLRLFTFTGVLSGIFYDDFFDPQSVACRLESLPAGRHAVSILFCVF